MRALIAVTAGILMLFLALVVCACGSPDGRSAESALALESEVFAYEALEVECIACTGCFVSAHPNTQEYCGHLRETIVAHGPVGVLKLPCADVDCTCSGHQATISRVEVDAVGVRG